MQVNLTLVMPALLHHSTVARAPGMMTTEGLVEARRFLLERNKTPNGKQRQSTKPNPVQRALAAIEIELEERRPK